MLNGLMKSNGWFPTMFDDFFNTDFMPRANSTAPAVNVKESEKEYTMELAAPGIKKEYCRVAINDEGNLTIAIENKVEHKNEDKHHHYLRREFSYSNYEQTYMLPDAVNKMTPHYETSMALVTFSFGSVFGMVMVRMPSSTLAEIWSFTTSSGST